VQGCGDRVGEFNSAVSAFRERRLREGSAATLTVVEGADRNYCWYEHGGVGYIRSSVRERNGP